MKHKRKKLRFKRLFLFIFLPIILFIVIVFVSLNNFHFVKNTIDTINSNINIFGIPNSEYEVIGLDKNSNYLGIGQERVENKDGYFTKFTSSDNKVFLEYKQNGTSSWSNHMYWNGTMETDGCGITAMSIILSGYGFSYTPEDLRNLYYPVLNSNKISCELHDSFGLNNSDFVYDSVHLGADYICKYLDTGNPILICVWNKPSANRFTTASHYMVLLASDDSGMVYLSNPNGLDNTPKASGWYDINEIVPYIAKALFIESTQEMPYTIINEN